MGRRVNGSRGERENSDQYKINEMNLIKKGNSEMILWPQHTIFQI